jgi:nucleotide-binding universal stress UspA family protein
LRIEREVIVVKKFVMSELAAVGRCVGRRGNGARPMRCAVVGYDGSSASAAALAYAIGWAQRNDGGLVITHVTGLAESALAGTAALTGVAVADIGASDYSDEVGAEMTGVQTPWAYLAAHGDIAAQLVRVADSLRADVIVVGRSKRSKFKSMRSSVGNRLLMIAGQIVVVV